MTATVDRPVEEAPSGGKVPLVELKNIGKSYGNITALKDISLRVHAGEVTGILGDNGAGKSTLIKIIAGYHPQTDGELLVDGESIKFTSPKDALGKGIATVYQNLAVVPLMPVWRNFFLGQEIRQGRFPWALDSNAMRATTLTELSKMGIELPDVDVPIGSLSGGQRQCVAIARAVFFGARVLILDEPTAALGVKQSGVVLKYITAAKEAGFGVVFITHNPHHAHMVGDHFVLLNRGQQKLDCTYDDITLEHLTQEMAGGDELEALSHELRGRQELTRSHACCSVRGVDIGHVLHRVGGVDRQWRHRRAHARRTPPADSCRGPGAVVLHLGTRRRPNGQPVVLVRLDEVVHQQISLGADDAQGERVVGGGHGVGAQSGRAAGEAEFHVAPFVNARSAFLRVRTDDRRVAEPAHDVQPVTAEIHQRPAGHLE